MKNLFILLFALAPLCLGAQEYTWRKVEMDGTRTGCVSPSKDNVQEALGTFKGNKYIAPDGTVYKKNSAVAKTAKVVIDAQPKMARVKDFILSGEPSLKLVCRSVDGED